jgi:hypothetical protein
MNETVLQALKQYCPAMPLLSTDLADGCGASIFFFFSFFYTFSGQGTNNSTVIEDHQTTA